MVNNKVIDAQRKKQSDMITQLKMQLEELESYAYESGEAIIPSNMLLERQRIVMGKNISGNQLIFLRQACTLANIFSWQELQC